MFPTLPERQPACESKFDMSQNPYKSPTGSVRSAITGKTRYSFSLGTATALLVLFDVGTIILLPFLLPDYYRLVALERLLVWFPVASVLLLILMVALGRYTKRSCRAYVLTASILSFANLLLWHAVVASC